MTKDAFFLYCHTRSRGKTHPIAWPKRWYYFQTNPASQPAANLLLKTGIDQDLRDRSLSNFKINLK